MAHYNYGTDNGEYDEEDADARRDRLSGNLHSSPPLARRDYKLKQSVTPDKRFNLPCGFQAI